MRNSLISNLIALFIISIITGIILLVLSLLNIEPNRLLISTGTSFVLMVVLLLVFKKAIKKFIDTTIVKYILGHVNKAQEGHFGFVVIHSNLDSLKSQLRKEFKNAANVKLLVQLGKGIIGVDRTSILFDAAMERKGSKDFEMKILVADNSSEYLTKAKMDERNTEYSKIQTSINYVHKSIEVLRTAGVNVKYKKHCQPFLCTMFLFDSKLYFVPFLFKNDNHEKAPIFEFHTIGDGGFLELFDKYFEHLWNHSETGDS